MDNNAIYLNASCPRSVKNGFDEDSSTEGNRMQIKTILNQIENHKSFVYDKVRILEKPEGREIEVLIRARANSKPVCSCCGACGSRYDTRGVRRFSFVPLWGIPVFFLYALRRVRCKSCGIKIERVPWAEGKNHITNSFAWFLAGWAKRLSWKETAKAFHTTWDNVFNAVEMAVGWGGAHVNLDGIKSIGIDEIQWLRGHKYLTLVYQIDVECRRLLWIGRDRNVRTLLRFFRWFGAERTTLLRFVCSDMWKPYLKVIAKKTGSALHVLDRFHIVANLNKTLDAVRADEARRLQSEGSVVLKNTRWCLLKHRTNLNRRQKGRLKELLRMNLKTIRAYLLKEEFQLLWRYTSPAWAGKFIDAWCATATPSNI